MADQGTALRHLIVISAQPKGISAYVANSPHFPIIRGDVFHRIVVKCNLYVGPTQACNPFVFDRFDLRQLIWENTLDTIELDRFSRLQNELGIAFGSSL